jgi:hypothetical protein
MEGVDVGCEPTLFHYVVLKGGAWLQHRHTQTNTRLKPNEVVF